MIQTINNRVVRGIDVSNYPNVWEDISMNIYYVYAYLRNKDSATAKAGTPYYIGKGKTRSIETKEKMKLAQQKRWHDEDQ